MKKMKLNKSHDDEALSTANAIPMPIAQLRKIHM